MVACDPANVPTGIYTMQFIALSTHTPFLRKYKTNSHRQILPFKDCTTDYDNASPTETAWYGHILAEDERRAPYPPRDSLGSPYEISPFTWIRWKS